MKKFKLPLIKSYIVKHTTPTFWMKSKVLLQDLDYIQEHNLHTN